MTTAYQVSDWLNECRDILRGREPWEIASLCNYCNPGEFTWEEITAAVAEFDCKMRTGLCYQSRKFWAVDHRLQNLEAMRPCDELWDRLIQYEKGVDAA